MPALRRFRASFTSFHPGILEPQGQAWEAFSHSSRFEQSLNHPGPPQAESGLSVLFLDILPTTSFLSCSEGAGEGAWGSGLCVCVCRGGWGYIVGTEGYNQLSPSYRSLPPTPPSDFDSDLSLFPRAREAGDPATLAHLLCFIASLPQAQVSEGSG